MHRPSLTGDYPRVGGEKAIAPHPAIVHLRITPAWAGKSLFCFTAAVPIQDHPRVGGEKVAAALVYTGGTGSPPHGRGKDPTGICGKDLPGITPA